MVGRIIHRPTLALEGPNRVLVWEDHEGVWMTRDTMRHYLRYIAGRHEAQTNQGNLRLHEDKVAAMIDNVAR